MKKFYSNLLAVIAFVMLATGAQAQNPGNVGIDDEVPPCPGQPVTFIWDEFSPAAEYRLNLGTNPGGNEEGTIGRAAIQDNEMYTTGIALTEGGTYYANIEYTLDGGATYVDWGIYEFDVRVLPTAPTGISIIADVDQGSNADKAVCNSVPFKVYTTGGTMGTLGLVEWSTDNFATIIDSTDNDTLEVPGGIAAGTTYYARRIDTACGIQTASVNQAIALDGIYVEGFAMDYDNGDASFTVVEDTMAWHDDVLVEVSLNTVTTSNDGALVGANLVWLVSEDAGPFVSFNTGATTTDDLAYQADEAATFKYQLQISDGSQECSYQETAGTWPESFEITTFNVAEDDIIPSAANIEYRIDGGAWMPYAGPVSDCAGDVEFRFDVDAFRAIEADDLGNNSLVELFFEIDIDQDGFEVSEAGTAFEKTLGDFDGADQYLMSDAYTVVAGDMLYARVNYTDPTATNGTASNNGEVGADLSFYATPTVGTAALTYEIDDANGNTDIAKVDADDICPGEEVRMDFVIGTASLTPGTNAKFRVYKSEDNGAWEQVGGDLTADGTVSTTFGGVFSLRVQTYLVHDCGDSIPVPASDVEFGVFTASMAYDTITVNADDYKVCDGASVNLQALNGSIGNDLGGLPSYGYSFGYDDDAAGTNDMLLAASTVNTTFAFDGDQIGGSTHEDKFFYFEISSECLASTKVYIEDDLGEKELSSKVIAEPANNVTIDGTATATILACGDSTVTIKVRNAGNTDVNLGDGGTIQYRVNGAGIWKDTIQDFDFDVVTGTTLLEVRVLDECDPSIQTSVATVNITHQDSASHDISIVSAENFDFCIAGGAENKTFTANVTTIGTNGQLQWSTNNSGVWMNTDDATNSSNFTVSIDNTVTEINVQLVGACNAPIAQVDSTVSVADQAVGNVDISSDLGMANYTCDDATVSFDFDTDNDVTLNDGTFEYVWSGASTPLDWNSATSTNNPLALSNRTIYQDTVLNVRITDCNGVVSTGSYSIDHETPADLTGSQVVAYVKNGMNYELVTGPVCLDSDLRFVFKDFVTLGDNATIDVNITGGGAGVAGAVQTMGDDSVYVDIAGVDADIDVDFFIENDCFAADFTVVGSESVTFFGTIPAALTVTKDKDNICANAGDVVTLTIVSPAAIAFPYAYEWSSYDPQALAYDSLTSNTDQTYMVSPDSTTTYAVRVVGCGDSTAYSANLVTVKDTNVIDGATALASPSSVCQGGSSTLSLIDYTLGTNSNVVWYDNMGGTKLAQGPSFSVSNLNTVNLDTTFYVRLEGDCDTTAYKMVTIGTSFVTPVAPASVDGAPAMAVCQNTPVTLTATGPNGTQEAMSHIWEFSNDGVVYNVLSDVDNVLNLANLNAANFDVNGEATVYIRVKRTNSCDESAYSTPVTIDVQQTPGTVTSVSTDKAIYCTMELVTVTATFNHTGYNGKLEYSYDAGMNWVDTNTVMSQDLGLGVQGIMVRLNSDCGMSASVNKNVTVREAPQDVMISINTDDTVCVTEDVNLSYMSVNAGTPAGAVSYMVSTDGGITYMATGATVDLDALALDFGGTGVATVFVKVSLSNSCGSIEDIHSFKVFNDVKIIDFSASASEFCANDLQTVTLTAVSSVNIPADYNWDLYVNGVFDQSVAGNSTTEAMFTVNPNTTTTYGVKLNGCGYETPTEVTNIITVRDTADISMATITTDADGDTIICEGSEVKFTLNLNGGSKGYNGVVTWWSGTDSLGTGDTYTITVDQDTTLYAVIYSDCNISEPSVMKTIQIYSADDIHVPMMPLEVCAGADTNLNSLFTSSMMYGPDGGVFSGTGVTGGVFNGDTAGMYTINYAFEFGSGCTYSKDFMIKVYSAPEAEVVDGSIIGDACNGEGSFELTNIGEIAFVIDSVDAMVDGRTVNVGDTTLLDNLQAGVKTLYLSNNIGCNSSISVTVPQLTGLDATIDTINSKLVVCGGEDDGSLIVLATGGTAPYTYSFGGVNNGNNDTLMLDGTENLLPIVVEDNTGCQFTLNSIPFAGNSVYQSSIGNLTITNIVEPDCAEDANGRFDVIATGNDAPFMYSLDGVNFQAESRFDNLVANVYFVTVMNTVGCTKEFVSTLNGPDSIDVVFNELGGNPTDGWDIEFVATGGNGGFELSLDGGATFSTDLAPTGVATGIYDFVIRDVKGCTVSGQVTVGNVGVANLNDFEASVYPNPFQDEVIVEATGIKSVKVLGLNGQLQATDMVFSNDKVRISTGDLAKGIYFIEVANDNAKVIKRVVKN